MSHSKETPRQKMISMMYLVLTCLLAINVSREVLDGFVTINESIENTNSNFTGNTQKIVLAINDAIRNGHHEFEPYLVKAKRVTELTQQTFDYVEKMKHGVILYTEDKEGADTLNLKQVESLDDYDKPTYFLIGPDETKLKAGAFSALELRQKITALADSMNGMLDQAKQKNVLHLPEADYLVLKDKIGLLRPQDHFRDKEGKLVGWELKNFYNMPLAAVVTNLSKIQSDLRNLEAELVNTFAAAPSKLSVKFNRLQACIVPVSHYIQAGSSYKADVFLTASSTDFREDNLQFILGEVDTASGVLAPGATVLPVEQGTGKISLPAGGVGHRGIKGWIKFREGTGNWKYFRYQNEYIVANSSVAVSADKMNVFYAGVDNPVTISAAGVAPGDLMAVISGSGGGLVALGEGKYMARVSGTGTCGITVYQKTSQGLKQEGLPQVFRIKRIPNPPLRIGSKSSYGDLELKPAEARNISFIGVDNSGFEFNAPFKVKSFTIYVVSGGQGYGGFTCTGNQLSDDAKKSISRLKTGSKIYFEDIKVEAPDGPRSFPMMRVLVR